MKKQIAVLMAAATAVTTVAPAVANAVDVTKNDASISEVVSKVRKALDDRYADKGADGIREPQRNKVEDYLNSKYAVLVNVAGGDFVKLADNTVYGGEFDSEIKELNEEYNNSADWYVVDDADKLGKVLEKNTDAVVAFIDKGHDGDRSTRDTKFKHYVSELSDADAKDYEVVLADDILEVYNNARKTGAKTSTYVENLKVDGETYVSDKEQLKGDLTLDSSKGDLTLDSSKGDLTEDSLKIKNAKKAELRLTSGKTINLELNGDAFDLKKAKNEAGGDVTLGENIDQKVYDTIAKFELIDNEEKESREVDIVNGNDVEAYKVSRSQIVKEINLKDVYTKDNGYTESGADFVNDIKNLEVGDTFNVNGVNYTLETAIDKSAKPEIKKDGDAYKFELVLNAYETGDEATKKEIKYVVKSDSQSDLYTVRDDMMKPAKTDDNNNDVVSGRFTKLAGSNRYATAVEVSKEQFDDDESADTVVIVGGKASMDGLSAAPLAAAKNAPVLLADPKDGLNNDTMKEIDRVTKDLNKKTVYIVGGENSVPASVEKQLKDKFNCSIVRLSGNDRMATSLSVAKRLVNDGNAEEGTKLFVVGRDGAADAMSISAVASKVVKDGGADAMSISAVAPKVVKNDSLRKVDPILVVPQSGVSRDTRDYLTDKMKPAAAYLIGGNVSLSTQVLDDMKIVIKNNEDVKRVSGVNRYETNVEVVKAFYEADVNKADGVFFASGEDQYLVDAQTSGVLAASKNAPLVLTGKKLTNNQVKLMNDDAILSKNNVGKNVYQIGGVVSSDVMKVVVDKLDL